MYRRSRAAIYIGLVFFGLLGVAAAVGGVARGLYAGIIWLGIVALPILKLRDALRALSRDATRRIGIPPHPR